MRIDTFKLRRLMGRSGINETKLCALAGVGRATLQRMRKYDGRVSLDTASKIARALKVKVFEIVDYTARD